MSLTNKETPKSHILGYPRMGEHRELKWALEDYWAGKISQQQLISEGQAIKQHNWRAQLEAGLDFISAGDFAWYDQVLNMTSYLGVVPNRFQHTKKAPVDLDTYFRMARGRAPSGKDAAACDMSKWFNTNYHYIVPEFSVNQAFHLNPASLLEEIKQAQDFCAGTASDVKPVLVGPLTYLWLGKAQDEFDVLSLLPQLLLAYGQLIHEIAKLGVQWLQIDEPILVLDLPAPWKSAFERAYNQLNKSSLKILLATYFSGLGDNLTLACQLPCDGLHVDLVDGEDDITQLLDRLPSYKILSLGLVNGRNIWKNPLIENATWLQALPQPVKDRIWIASSCSLLHSPINLDNEKKWAPELKNKFSFARQKLSEIVQLANSLNSDQHSIQDLSDQQNHIRSVGLKGKHNSADKDCCDYDRKNPFFIRKQKQQTRLNLPEFPTTTIGSFPQTQTIRQARKAFKQGLISVADYETEMKGEIKNVIEEQEALGLDVLVHGEAERNDMVEYFGEQLSGYEFSENGWVQSYGSRCVKPPIIASDITRPKPMTVKWSQYAQSLTKLPVKGMLTGPITMLFWSFQREDISLKSQAYQLALALQQEVDDLQQAGIAVIQVDEPALREGLPLKQAHKKDYLTWAVNAFKLSVASAEDHTQIHTHMCYSEFNDIIQAISHMDADVITIETSRSNMALLNAFAQFQYPNDIGPGIYDIHSPVVPNEKWMLGLMEKARSVIPAQQLWVNPDCGLKTRAWPETRAALALMVNVANTLRNHIKLDANNTEAETEK